MTKKNNLLEQYHLEYGVNNPILRTICDEVTVFDHDLNLVAHDMQKLQRIWYGTWLAAPQIGIPIQLITTIQWKKKWKKMVEVGETILINPHIIEQSEQTFSSEESCLSLPDIVDYVPRAKIITVEYQDLFWNHKKKTFSDYNAAVVQHEIDHLHGILFVDKKML